MEQHVNWLSLPGWCSRTMSLTLIFRLRATSAVLKPCLVTILMASSMNSFVNNRRVISGLDFDFNSYLFMLFIVRIVYTLVRAPTIPGEFTTFSKSLRDLTQDNSYWTLVDEVQSPNNQIKYHRRVCYVPKLPWRLDSKRHPSFYRRLNYNSKGKT